ncbi:hypothetical protein [Serratia sp. NPDC087055]|uniref:hypothetical protein n=1 Tax=Serratia sp. NPDC087055 TaxID=3364516 RepID=UPI00384B3F0D
MPEIETLKAELVKVRSELEFHKALFLTILRELPPSENSAGLMLKYGKAVSDLDLVDADLSKKTPTTITQVLQLRGTRK